MIKTFILVRHSKAEDRDNKGNDIVRPLTDKGKTDTFKIANLLIKSGIKPDLVLSSTATRAVQTVKIFSEVLKIHEKHLDFTRKLYYSSSKTMLDFLYGLPDACNCVMIVAHNPGISDLVRGLTSGKIYFMENTRTVVLEFNIEHWHQVNDSTPSSIKSYNP
jgi:phosphohistidine phosphatase